MRLALLVAFPDLAFGVGLAALLLLLLLLLWLLSFLRLLRMPSLRLLRLRLEWRLLLELRLNTAERFRLLYSSFRLFSSSYFLRMSLDFFISPYLSFDTMPLRHSSSKLIYFIVAGVTSAYFDFSIISLMFSRILGLLFTNSKLSRLSYCLLLLILVIAILSPSTFGSTCSGSCLLFLYLGKLPNELAKLSY
jgi:hypothetical protein